MFQAAAVYGSRYYALPAGCGAYYYSYYSCGGVYYAPQYEGDTVVYVTVPDPKAGGGTSVVVAPVEGPTGGPQALPAAPSAVEGSAPPP